MKTDLLKCPCVFIAIIISLRIKPECSKTFASVVIKHTSKTKLDFPGEKKLVPNIPNSRITEIAHEVL